MRTALSKKTRFEVFKRDEFTCQYCGARPPQAVLNVDHINPVAEGGKNDIDNLVTACESCNAGKGARLLTSVPMSLKEKAALVAEKEAQLRGYNEILEAKRERIYEDAWRVANVHVERFGTDGIRKDYFASIKKFTETLGVHDCVEAMEKAISRKWFGEDQAFRYFCGICWRKIKGPDADVS